MIEEKKEEGQSEGHFLTCSKGSRRRFGEGHPLHNIISGVFSKRHPGNLDIPEQGLKCISKWRGNAKRGEVFEGET